MQFNGTHRANDIGRFDMNDMTEIESAKDAAEHLGVPGAEEFLDWHDEAEGAVKTAPDGSTVCAVDDQGRVAFVGEYHHVYLILPSFEAARAFLASGEVPEGKWFVAASDLGTALAGEDEDAQVKFVTTPWFDVDEDEAAGKEFVKLAQARSVTLDDLKRKREIAG